MKTQWLPWLATFVIAHMIMSSTLRAAEPTLDEQYLDVAKARTEAELAIRKTRAMFEENDNHWRTAWASLDQARTLAAQAIDLAIQDEQRRPEDVRSQPVIEDLSARRRDIDKEWQRFSAVDRPAMDQSYQLSRNLITNNMGQVFQYVTQWEPAWKEAKVDVTALKASYDAITRRALEIRAQVQKTLDDLDQAQKKWDAISAAATQPAVQEK